MTEPYGRRWASPTNRIHGAWIVNPKFLGSAGNVLFCTRRPVGSPWRMVTNDATITCTRCLAVVARLEGR
jgi:hypothetical protein